MILYRPHRGSLDEAMAEMKTFDNIDDMKKHIIKELDIIDSDVDCCGPEDILFKGLDMDDHRIGWKNVHYVLIRRFYHKKYKYPQVVGQCTFDA